MLNEAEIIKFQQLYKEHLGQEISREEALQKGIRLLRIIELTYKPMTEEDFEKLLARHI